MANNPKKVKDPTEVALSAIQEALNISDAPPAGRDEVSVHHEAVPSVSPSYDDGAFDVRAGNDRQGRQDRQPFEPVEEQRFPRRPANDDRETIGQILQAIQQGRPARNVYALATLFAAVWVIGAGLLTISFLPSLQAFIGHGGGGTLALAGLVTVFFAPVLLFYFLASLAWRGQELRMI